MAVTLAAGGGAAVEHVAGLGVVGLDKIIVAVVEDREGTLAAMDLQAVDLGEVPGNQFGAVVSGAGEVIVSGHTVHGVGHKFIAGDGNICTVQRNLGSGGRQGQGGGQQDAADGGCKSLITGTMEQAGHPFTKNLSQ